MVKLKYIDAIRGIAILGVFFVHTAYHSSFPYPIRQIISAGAMGVQLFFIASALTLFMSMEERNDRERYPVGNFFIRRFFRIAPMYYLAIVYYSYHNLWTGYPHSAALILSNFLFIHGVSPYWINSLVPGGWSITVEMMFYCLLPFLFARIRNMNQALVFLLLSLGLRFVFLLAMQPVLLPESNALNHDFLFFCLPNQLPVFGLGIFLFFYIKGGYRAKGLKPLYLLLLAILLSINCLIRGSFPYHIFISMGLIPFCVYLSMRNPRLFVNKFTVFLGKISFSFYLVHFDVKFWILRWFGYFQLPARLPFAYLYLLTMASIFAVSVLISLFFYHTIEVGFRQWGRAIIRRRAHLPSPPDREQDSADQ